jgi:hypothetical protein
MSRFGHAPLRRLYVAAGTALVLAACGDDDNGGAPFSAEGTSSDVNAVSSAFNSPAMSSLTWSASGIDGVFGAPMVTSSIQAINTAGHNSGNLVESARRLGRSAASFNGSSAVHVALAVIPAQVLGKTFEYNTETAQYAETARAGAPANGVRFILYAINPVTQVPVEPLAEAGYADLLDQSTATSDAVRLQVVSSGVTYLDYGVSGSGDESAGNVLIDGFVTNGTTLVNFDLDNSYSEAANGTIGFDYSLDAPSLDIDLKYLLSVSQISTDAVADVDVTVSGPHGDVGIEGQVTGEGSLTATVNGEAFAVMHLDEGSEISSITKPDGSALTAPEYAALAAIWGFVLKGLDVFEDLLEPVDNLL